MVTHYALFIAISILVKVENLGYAVPLFRDESRGKTWTATSSSEVAKSLRG
jgi:hypothetical protein